MTWLPARLDRRAQLSYAGRNGVAPRSPAARSQFRQPSDHVVEVVEAEVGYAIGLAVREEPAASEHVVGSAGKAGIREAVAHNRDGVAHSSVFQRMEALACANRIAHLRAFVIDHAHPFARVERGLAAEHRNSERPRDASTERM